MKCEQAELRMAELLAGEIAPQERAGLERHLLDCGACRADFELARAGARIEWADVTVPPEVIEATLASFREPPPAVRLLRWATAAAAVFGVAALLLTSSRAEKPVPVASPEVGCRFDRGPVLATMQEAVVGALVCKDEEGKPVGELGLRSHDVSVEILDGIAKTTVEENFENHTDRRLEGTFHFPLPSDASISRLALEVNGKIEEGTCLERERAREVFDSIVRKMQDPALLEWQPGGLFKCRVFPIEPRSTKRVIVAYTQALPSFRGKMTYVYPLASEKTRTHPPGEVTIAVRARYSGPLARVESPSHHLDVQRKDANEASMSFRAANYRPSNDFVVTLETGDEDVRVVSHKSDGEDGYFACFATPRGGGERAPARYAFVLDASASISAPRLDVAKRLVRAMMERRIDGDRFEVLAHNVEVERSGEVDLRAANTFMDGLRPIGGSDVLQALQAAGDAEVVYIGKGAATFGETDASKIIEAVKGRRIRTIAVGSDANGTLLERLGGMMRISPNDDVNKRVAEIAATLGSPVLSDVKVDGGDAVYDVVGVRDLFYGERLVLSGRYRGPASKLVISGRGYRREVEVSFPAKEEGNNYVRRLWAQRKVSDLLARGPEAKAEVTELGVKHQIMTPYTSFLVLETEQMWKDFQLKREVQKQDEVLGQKGKEELPPAPTVVLPVTKASLRPAPARPLAGKSEDLPNERFPNPTPEVILDTVVVEDLRMAEGELRRAIWALDGTRQQGTVGRGGADPSATQFWMENGEQLGWLNDRGVDIEGKPKFTFNLETEKAGVALQSDLIVLARQLEVEHGRQLATGADEHREKLVKGSRQSLGVAKARHSRLSNEELLRELAEFEERHVELSRDKRQLEEKLNAIAQAGGNVNVAPKKALEAKVTAVANEIGLVVISIGKDDGVFEGDEFTVYRGGDFVAKIVIDRSDRKWSAGKVVLKKTNPRVADDVSNHIFVSSVRGGSSEPRAACTMPGIAMEVISAGEDGRSILLKMKGSAVATRQIFAVTRAGKFVSLIQVEQVAASGAEARIWKGVAVGRILPGDRAEYVVDPRGYLALLPEEVHLELSSRASQQAIRAKMGLKE